MWGQHCSLCLVLFFLFKSIYSNKETVMIKDAVNNKNVAILNK